MRPLFPAGLPKALAAASLVLTLGLPAHASEATRSITLSASGEVVAKPDTAFINTGVTSFARTADAALAENSRAMRAILDALIDEGLSEEDIQTTNFSISPQQTYHRDGRPPKITGYRVFNSVRIRVRDIARMSDILDQVTALGSNQINGISFSVDDREALLDRARRLAIKKARKRAELYASSAGVRLGEVLSITEQSAHRPAPRPFMMRTVKARSSAPPIQPGSQKWRVTVRVRFALE